MQSAYTTMIKNERREMRIVLIEWIFWVVLKSTEVIDIEIATLSVY